MPDAGVADDEFEAINVVLHRRGVDLQGDFALLGELDGVADEVEEDLPHARGVAVEAGEDVRVDEGDEVDLVAPRGEGEEVDDFVDAGGQGEGLLLEDDLAGLDLGEIEDFVDQA